MGVYLPPAVSTAILLLRRNQPLPVDLQEKLIELGYSPAALEDALGR